LPQPRPQPQLTAPLFARLPACCSPPQVRLPLVRRRDGPGHWAAGAGQVGLRGRRVAVLCGLLQLPGPGRPGLHQRQPRGGRHRLHTGARDSGGERRGASPRHLLRGRAASGSKAPWRPGPCRRRATPPRLAQVVSDPLLNAWFDGKFNENADKCSWEFGPGVQREGVRQWNTELGGKRWLIQVRAGAEGGQRPARGAGGQRVRWGASAAGCVGGPCGAVPPPPPAGKLRRRQGSWRHLRPPADPLVAASDPLLISGELEPFAQPRHRLAGRLRVEGVRRRGRPAAAAAPSSCSTTRPPAAAPPCAPSLARSPSPALARSPLLTLRPSAGPAVACCSAWHQPLHRHMHLVYLCGNETHAAEFHPY
jgi:hypothetical protein